MSQSFGCFLESGDRYISARNNTLSAFRYVKRNLYIVDRTKLEFEDCMYIQSRRYYSARVVPQHSRIWNPDFDC